MIFRVHFADGSKIDIDAATAEAARKQAAKQVPGVKVLKIKIVREP